jgi:hypothetical protein
MPNRRPVGTEYERPVSAESERPGHRRRRLTAAQAGRSGLDELVELTGKEPEGVTGVEPSGEEGWRVTVEFVEDRRIPSSTDILATYRIDISPDGELISYQRIRRYARGRGDDGDLAT